MTYASHPYPVLVKSRPLDHLGLERVVDLGHELERQRLHDDGRGYAVREQVV